MSTAVSSTATADQLGNQVLNGMLHSTSQRVIQDAVSAADGLEHTRVAAIEQVRGAPQNNGCLDRH
jgi:hypothetical protein